MNVQLARIGARSFIGTADLNKYHWYATRTGELVRGGVAETPRRKCTPHDTTLHVGEVEARYVGVYTINYVNLPFAKELQEAVNEVWRKVG
jgi:hypothetical protein